VIEPTWCVSTVTSAVGEATGDWLLAAGMELLIEGFIDPDSQPVVKDNNKPR
jgi:hypothetical protein